MQSKQLNNVKQISDILSQRDTIENNFIIKLEKIKQNYTAMLQKVSQQYTKQIQQARTDSAQVLEKIKNKFLQNLEGARLYMSKYQSAQLNCTQIKTREQLIQYIDHKLKDEELQQQYYQQMKQYYVVHHALQSYRLLINKDFLESLDQIIPESEFNLDDYQMVAFHKMKLEQQFSKLPYNSLKLSKQLKTSHTKAIYKILFLDNEQYFATCSDDATIQIYDAGTNSLLRTLKGHKSRVWNIIKIICQPKIASASSDTFVIIWNYLTGVQLAVLKGHTSFVTSLLELPNNILVSASHDKTLMVWDHQAATQLRVISLVKPG